MWGLHTYMTNTNNVEYESIEVASAEAMRTGRNIICFVDGTLIKVYMMGSWRPATPSDRKVFEAYES